MMNGICNSSAPQFGPDCEKLNKIALIHVEGRKLQEINEYINQNCQLYLHTDNKDLAWVNLKVAANRPLDILIAQ